MERYVLGIDGGQTATKAALATLDGDVLAQAVVGPWDAMSNEPGRQLCRRSLDEAMGALLPAVGPDSSCAAACLGLTSGEVGVDAITAWLGERVQTERVQVLSDMVTNLRGADPEGGPGIVVIAGGGSVAWGRGPDGQTALAGAHGYLLDDEGSGYELGRQGLIAALQASHGRRPPTALIAAICAHFGAASMQTVRDLVYSGGVGRPELAALAPLVCAAARAGDGAALAVVGRGARSLAEMAAAVVARLPFPAAPVYPTGGVFAAGEVILAPFSDRLHELAPLARVTAPVLAPLGGALTIALEAAGALSPGPVQRLRSTLGG